MKQTLYVYINPIRGPPQAQTSEQNRAYGDKNFHYIGDAWTFIGIDRSTKLVLAFEVGKRNTESARKFMRKIALAASNEQNFQLTTDGFAPYNYAVGMELDGRVDYAQLVKSYASPTPEEQRPAWFPRN